MAITLHSVIKSNSMSINFWPVFGALTTLRAAPVRFQCTATGNRPTHFEKGHSFSTIKNTSIIQFSSSKSNCLADLRATPVQYHWKSTNSFRKRTFIFNNSKHFYSSIQYFKIKIIVQLQCSSSAVPVRYHWKSTKPIPKEDIHSPMITVALFTRFQRGYLPIYATLWISEHISGRRCLFVQKQRRNPQSNCQ